MKVPYLIQLDFLRNAIFAHPVSRILLKSKLLIYQNISNSWLKSKDPKFMVD